MSQQTPNPTQSTAAQVAAQAAQAALQAAKAKTTAVEDADAESPTQAENDEQLAKAWGFASKRPKLSKEAVIGLIAIIALLGMFSFVIARHFRNRATLAENPGKVDPDIKPASTVDPFAQDQNNVASELNDFDNSQTKKPSTKGLNLDEEMLDLSDGQSEPMPTRVATQKQSLPINLEDEFDTFGDNAATSPQTRSAPKTSEEPLEIVDETPNPKTNRATVTLDFDEPLEPEEPPLTKTTGPIRLKQPIQAAPAEEFEKPVETNVAQQIEDEFEIVPQRARQPVRVAQKDMFTENTGFDDPKTRTSPTTDLPPARERTVARPTQRHPLLKEGEYLIEEGDNFCLISKKLYGTDKYFLALAEHNRNRVADPCRMRPGLVISAPTAGVLEQQHPTLVPKPKTASEAGDVKSHSTQKVSDAPLPSGMFQGADGMPWYRVGKGDTLTGIAQAHLGRISRAEQIFNLNRERLRNRDDLRLGQELRLPNDASQVRLVETEKSLR